MNQLVIKRYNSKLDMFVLALLPILNIYESPIPIFPIGNLLAVILMAKYFIMGHKIESIFHLPPLYKVFWIWAAISYAITKMSIGAVVPGGLVFCIFTLIMCYMATVFDMKVFRLSYRLVFIVCSIVFFVQFFSILRTGTFAPALIPWLKLADGTDMSALIFDQQIFGRACSFFREPAHFAQYMLPLLAIELFDKSETNKILSPFAAFLILVLLLLRSGNGLVGLALMILVKLYHISIKSKFKTKVVSVLIAIPLMLYSADYYIKTTIGEEMMGRYVELENDQSAHSWARVWRGYYIYGSLPTLNKVIGASDQQVLDYMPSNLFLSDAKSSLYVNGIQQVLISKGIIGIFIFAFMLTVWMKRSNTITSALIIFFIGLCFVAQLYLSDVMLYVFVIVVYYYRKQIDSLCIR